MSDYRQGPERRGEVFGRWNNELELQYQTHAAFHQAIDIASGLLERIAELEAENERLAGLLSREAGLRLDEGQRATDVAQGTRASWQYDLKQLEADLAAAQTQAAHWMNIATVNADREKTYMPTAEANSDINELRKRIERLEAALLAAYADVVEQGGEGDEGFYEWRGEFWESVLVGLGFKDEAWGDLNGRAAAAMLARATGDSESPDKATS